MPLQYNDSKGFHYEAISAPEARVALTVFCPHNHATDCEMSGLRPNKDKSIGAKKLQIEWFCNPCDAAYITYLD